MAKPDIVIVVRDPLGSKLDEITAFASLDYILVEKDIGALTLQMGRPLPLSWYGRDLRLEVWRNGLLEGETQWFTRQPESAMQSDGALLHTLLAYDAKELLRRRINAYKATTAQSLITAPLDDLMKAVVRNNYTAAATDPLRNLGTYLQVALDQSLCASKPKTLEYEIVLTALQEIAQESAGDTPGIYLTFDIVSVSDAVLEFRTYTGQRGIDHRSPSSAHPVLIAQESGTLAQPRIVYDYTQEKTVVYAGGAGEGVARSLTVGVDVRATASPFNRYESFLDMSSAEPTEIVPAIAGALWDGRPRVRFTGKLVDTAGVQYGVQYRHGDLITASFLDHSFDCRVDPVHVTIDSNGETLDVGLSGDVVL